MEKTGSNRRCRQGARKNSVRYDHLLYNDQTADAINDTVTSAAQPFPAKRPKDEDWVLSNRAQVTELSKQRSDEVDEANHRRSVTTKVEGALDTSAG